MSDVQTRRRTADSGWQLEGNAAEAYEAYLVPAIFGACAERLVAAAAVTRGDRVLDVACGTGVVARAAARRVGPTGAVSGVDVNPDMLEAARGAATEAGPDIAWRRADAASLPYDDDAFDVVVCQEAVQFFGDRPAALREMRRVAVPGGRIAFSVWRSLERQPCYEILARALGEYAGLEAEAMMRSPFAFGDADALRALAEGAGLAGVEVRIAVGESRYPSVEELVRREAASSPLAGPLSELEPDRRHALIEALREALAPHTDDAGVAFHNETHIVTGRA